MKSRFKDYEINPSSNAGTDGQGCGRIGGDDPADPKCDPLLRFGGGDRAEGRCRHRPRDHPAGKDLPARMGRVRRSAAVEPESRTAGRRLLRAPTGPAPTAMWTKDSGPGEVKFADAKALITTATFSTPGAYVLRLTVDNGQSKRFLHLERVGGDAAPGEAARCGLHEEFQNQQSAVERARQGPDGELDSALHRPDQPHRPDAGTRRDRQFRGSREGAARRTARRAQGICVLQRLGAPDRGGDEHRADDRPARRSGNHPGARENARHAGRLDSQDPGRAGAGRISANGIHAAPGRRARQRSTPARSSTGNAAAITKDTPRATFWNRPSTTT